MQEKGKRRTLFFNEKTFIDLSSSFGNEFGDNDLSSAMVVGRYGTVPRYRTPKIYRDKADPRLILPAS